MRTGLRNAAVLEAAAADDQQVARRAASLGGQTVRTGRANP